MPEVANAGNTPVTIEASNVSAGAHSDAPTFETMEAIVDAKVAEKKIEQKEARESRKEVKDVAKEAAKEVLESAKEEESEENPKSETSEKAKERTESQIRVVKAYDADGKEIELSDNIKIEQKVDGKVVSVTLAELGKNYSGKVVYEKKFQELHDEKKKFNESVEFVNSRIDHVLKLSEDSPVEAFFELCKISGRKPEDQVKVWQKFTEEAQKWSSMTEDQQNAMMAARERDYYKRTIENDEKLKAERQAKEQRNAERSKVKEVLKLSQEEFEETESFAASLYPGQELTAQHVILANRIKVAENVMSEVAPDQARPDSEMFRQIFNVAVENPEFTIADLKEIAAEAFGLESAKRLGRKAAPKPAAQEKTTPKRESPDTWDTV